jgi:DNA-directed RNA polymerase specialized sigma subunit
MNFLKYQAARLHEAINPRQARSTDLDRVEMLLLEACAIRNRIIRSYLGLVVSIAKKFTAKSNLIT